MTTRVTSKGQVTIPAEIREAAHIAAGTELAWTYDPLAACRT
jgi:AbrB family looped-hinge helix DNA binding protein